jgi:hypothetical protein
VFKQLLSLWVLVGLIGGCGEPPEPAVRSEPEPVVSESVSPQTTARPIPQVDDTKPDNTKPDNTKPDNTKPEETKPDETSPSDIVRDELHGLPLDLTFPDLPEVPEAIKGPSPPIEPE